MNRADLTEEVWYDSDDVSNRPWRIKGEAEDEVIVRVREGEQLNYKVTRVDNSEPGYVFLDVEAAEY